MPTESLAELSRVASDVYAFRHINHTGIFIVTNEGVILVDPIGQINPRTPYLIKEAIRSVTDLPVKYVVYSHSTPDHSTGGAVFADTAKFVGHSKAAPKMAAFNDPTTPAPEITFDKQMKLELGGTRLDLYSADLSRDDDYIVIHHPTSRVAIVVDFAQARSAPFQRFIGQPDRIADRLKWIHDTLDFDVVVTGHALPSITATKEQVLEQRQYLLDLSDAIAAARKTGAPDKSPEMYAAVRSTLGPKYGSWRRFDEFVDMNVEGMIDWRAREP